MIVRRCCRGGAPDLPYEDDRILPQGLLDTEDQEMPTASNRLVGLIILAMIVAGIAMPAGATWLEALFAPKAELWDRWTEHDPASRERIDHGVWQRLLATYVSRDESGLNRVAYARVTPADRQALADYVAGLVATPIGSFNRAEQRAYWINLYNALTVQLVLDHYRVSSIRDIDISPGLLADGPWDKKLVRIEGEEISLNDIEHRILRPIWRDPRIHYAVNCAAVGCPNLQRTAFTGENTEDLLDLAARDYVNNPRGARVEERGLVVSSIYSWFREDFGGDVAGVLAHLRRYAEPQLKRRLEGIDAIAGDTYDWTLNDAG
jgi:hypothetical protein